MKQRGFEEVRLVLYLVAAGLAIASITAGTLWVSAQIKAYGKAEREAGKAEVMALWQHEAIESAREDTEAARARQMAAAAHAKNLQGANARAAAAEEQLRREREEREQQQPSVTVEGCQPADGSRPVVRFTWGWVHDYDAAWTGRQGESLFGDRQHAAGAAERADAASPYGPAELGAVHADNAAKCSKTRRQLNELLDTLDDLERKEDERAKGGAP